MYLTQENRSVQKNEVVKFSILDRKSQIHNFGLNLEKNYKCGLNFLYEIGGFGWTKNNILDNIFLMSLIIDDILALCLFNTMHLSVYC